MYIAGDGHNNRMDRLARSATLNKKARDPRVGGGLSRGVRRTQSAAAALQLDGRVVAKEEVRLPLLIKTHLPFDFLLPAEGAIMEKDITDKHVHAWGHRFQPGEIDWSTMETAAHSDIERVHAVAYDMKSAFVFAIRNKLKTRFIRLCKQYYPEQARHFTRFSQVTSFLGGEILEGRGEQAFAIVYDKWPKKWEYQFEELFCQENNFFMRSWINKGKQYKGAVSKLASYVMSGLRSQFPNIKRRQDAEYIDGRKVRRRDKHKAKYDPEKHLQLSPKKERNRNGKREL